MTPIARALFPALWGSRIHTNLLKRFPISANESFIAICKVPRNRTAGILRLRLRVTLQEWFGLAGVGAGYEG